MKKKGFTLIELMIVLAVIAILAVVLVPKAGIFKSNAKNAGVTTNVNTVRAVLEAKTGNNFAKNVGEVETLLKNSFNATTSDLDNNIKNPFNDAFNVDNKTQPDKAPAIYVGTAEPKHENVKGSVVVIYDENGSYTVYGVDNSGAVIDKVTINK